MKRLIVMLSVLCACEAFSAAPETMLESDVMQRVDFGAIDPATGFPLPGAQWSISGGQVLLIGGWDVPVSFVVGAPVPTISATVRDNAETCTGCMDDNAVVMQLVSLGGPTATIVGQTLSNESGLSQTVTLNVTHTVAANEILRVRFLQWMELGQTPTRMSAIGMIQAGSLPIPAPETVTIPVVQPMFDGPRTEVFAIVDGCDCSPPLSPHFLFIPVAMPVGTTIRNVRLRVRDGGLGTRLRARLMRASDNAQALTIVAESQPSSGTSVEETICILCGVDAPVVTSPASQYYVKLSNVSGVRVSGVYRMEADIN